MHTYVRSMYRYVVQYMQTYYVYIYVQWMVFCFCRHYKDNVRVMKEPCNVGDVLACPACPSCIIEHACIFVTNKVNILLI